MAKELSNLESVSFQSTATYTFLEEIGRGGMGIVYLAERSSEGVTAQVVLKTIRHLASAGDEEMLLREANVATSLRHENIVRTFGLETIPYASLPEQFRNEVSELSDTPLPRQGAPARFGVRRYAPAGGKRYIAAAQNKMRLLKTAPDANGKKLYLIVMDYIDGVDLHTLHREHVRQGYLLPIPLAAFIISRVLRALDYAHKFIIHRDISPENILLNTQGVCKLSDFGIAANVSESSKSFAGKPEYMSPEQISRSELDGRTDIFSLGIVLYQLLTGINPLRPVEAMDLNAKVAFVKNVQARGIPPPHDVYNDVPKTLSDIVMKMLAMNRDGRYTIAREAGDDIEQKFIYKSGFGPTNNSLEAYLAIFEGGFESVLPHALKQLAFLKTDAGRIEIKRHLRFDRYTKPLGQKMVMDRKGSLLYKTLAEKEQQAKQKAAAAAANPS